MEKESEEPLEYFKETIFLLSKIKVKIDNFRGDSKPIEVISKQN